MDDQEDNPIKDIDSVGDVVLDRNQLLLPIRLYVNTTRISEMSHDDVIAGLPSSMFNRLAVTDTHLPPTHVELLAFHREPKSGTVRSIVVYGQKEHIGCVFNSTTTAAACCKGYNVGNNTLYVDAAMTRPLNTVINRFVNNYDLECEAELKELLLPNVEFSLHCRTSCIEYILSTCLRCHKMLPSGLVEHELVYCPGCSEPTNIDDPLTVVCCDGCQREYHFRCLEPPVTDLTELPAGDWLCDRCLNPKKNREADRLASAAAALVSTAIRVDNEDTRPKPIRVRTRPASAKVLAAGGIRPRPRVAASTNIIRTVRRRVRNRPAPVPRYGIVSSNSAAASNLAATSMALATSTESELSKTPNSNPSLAPRVSSSNRNSANMAQRTLNKPKMESARKPASRSGSVSRNRVRSTPVVSIPSPFTTIVSPTTTTPSTQSKSRPRPLDFDPAFAERNAFDRTSLGLDVLVNAATAASNTMQHAQLATATKIKTQPNTEVPDSPKLRPLAVKTQVVKAEQSGGLSSGDLIKDYAMHLRESPDDASLVELTMTFPALQTTQHQRPLAKRSHHAISSGSIVSAPVSRASRGSGASGLLCGTPSESDLPPPFWWNQCSSIAILSAEARQPPDWQAPFFRLPPPISRVVLTAATSSSTNDVSGTPSLNGTQIAVGTTENRVLSLADLFRALGIDNFLASFQENQVDLSDLWCLHEADYIAMMPQLGPRRRLQGYVRTYAKQLATLASQRSA